MGFERRSRGVVIKPTAHGGGMAVTIFGGPSNFIAAVQFKVELVVGDALTI